MKKLAFLMIVFCVGLVGCKQDPLIPIRRLARSDDLAKKMEASRDYQQVINVLRDAYKSNAGLCKDIGRALMMDRQFENALEYFQESVKTRSTDSTLYYWMAVCYVNRFKVDRSPATMATVHEYYEKSLNLMPNNKEVLYEFAQFLVFGAENYPRAIEVLQQNLTLLGSNFSADTYFLLGRAYYLSGEYDAALRIYHQILDNKTSLSKEQISRAEEFIDTTRMMLTGGADVGR